MATADDLRSELGRRQSLTEQVLAIFYAHPGEWIDWRVFAEAVGERAYRTRISNAKKVVVREGGLIESRTQHVGSEIRTVYRYALGRDPQSPVPDRWPIEGAPIAETWTLTPPEPR